ncbi:MAG: RhuM family protein [Sulfurovaceae bacterium]|nr:RhuM family protein [Sulfurovaceae bacterium]
MNKPNNLGIAIYSEGELELNISVDEETIWLTQKQLGELFEVTKQNISLHINRIFKEKELDKHSVVKFFLTTAVDGKTYNTKHYNLDMVISIGYKVNSKKATKFRQWATSILKKYIQNGYAINSEKITHERFKELENDVSLLKSKVENISNSLEDNSLKLKQGIFYNGQIFDAYLFVANLIKRAKSEVVLIDNYIDESVLTLLSKNQNIKITIYTQDISKQLRLDIQKYNKQYNNLEVKITKNFHDRFMMIDDREVYHIGASLKDLGNKVFAFSKFNVKAFEILRELE